MPRTSIITPEKFATFGELLRFLRRKANLTQRELSIAVGYSESQISRLEQNERAPEEATLAARFVPALYIEDEPQWVARLLDLGTATHTHAPEADALQPIAEAKPTPHNLPIQLTSFIGREKEITEIKRFLTKSEGSVRLLTLTGPGGCGKTRLAMQAASGLLDDFREGVWLIEFAPLADPALVPQTVAAVLGLKEQLGRPIQSTLIGHLRGKKILLILDNCEHLIQASAQFADALLRACPNVYILSTSREMLGIAGERALVVPSLSMPDAREAASLELLSQYEAVRLFAQRATTVMPEFILTQENASAIALICQRLDGIPLALELAAARIKVLRVEQIAARLTDMFRLLTGGTRTALPRQQTLQAALDWSYDLLSETERHVFNRLSVFAGGWTLEAAEAVCADEGIESTEILDVLIQLVNKSLVLAERSQGEETRYQLLEIVRQYALGKLTASGANAIRRRHAMYYVALAEARVEAFNSVSLQTWHNRMETEYDNMRAALAWSYSTKEGGELGLRLAGALGWFWTSHGQYWSEGRNWLEGALSHADVEQLDNKQLQAQILQKLGSLSVVQGDYAAGQVYFADSLKLFRAIGDVSASAYLLERMGWLARERGDFATARLLLEECLAIVRKLGDIGSIVRALNTLGEVLVMQEDIEGAARLLEESLSLSRELGEINSIGWALNHMGHVAQIQGEYERAIALHEESLSLFLLRGPYWVGIPQAHQALGETTLAQGNAALAANHLAEALELFRDMGDRMGISWCIAGLAGVAAVNEEPERAAWLWGAAEALRQSIGSRTAPAARATHERLQAEVCKQLGEAMFNTKWAEGQAVSLEQVIDEVLRV